MSNFTGQTIRITQEDIDKARKMKAEDSKHYLPSLNCAISQALKRIFPGIWVSSAFGHCAIDNEDYDLQKDGDRAIAMKWMDDFDFNSKPVEPIEFNLKIKT